MYSPPQSAIMTSVAWRDGRAVEGAALEKQYTGNGIEGSNPSFSAIKRVPALVGAFLMADVRIWSVGRLLAFARK